MPGLLYQAMTYSCPQELPVSVSLLPAAWKKYGDELKAVVGKYPRMFGDLASRYNYDGMTPQSYHTGSHTDEWGCVWENIEEGMESIVTGHPVKTREDIRNLKIPDCRDGRLPHGFMYLRLLDLRGFEEAMLDFAEEPEELQMLIDKVLEYNCIQIEAVVDRCGEFMCFGDDLGMQNGLAIGAQRWIRYLYPCYKRMYGIVHAYGKPVYMHSDGRIIDILDDLADAGVNMINPQFRANGIDDLARVCKGRIPVNLDLDRQLFPFASRKDIADHIRECAEKLYLPQGGLGLSAELGKDVPLDIIDCVIDTLDRYRFYGRDFK